MFKHIHARSFLRPLRSSAIAILCGLTILSVSGVGAQPDARNFSGAQGDLKRILKSGKLRVGLQRDFHPYHIQQAQKDYPGIDVEVARLLAEYLQVKLELVYGSLPELLDGVSSGRMDIALGGISSNLERSRRVYFSLPYITTTAGALIRRRSLPRESQSIEFSRKQYRRLPDLNQAGVLQLGALAGTSNLALLQNDPNFRKHKVHEFNDRPALLKALRDGEIDALVADAIYIKSLLLKDPGLESRYVALTQSYQPEHISVVLPHGEIHLFWEIQFALKELERDGRLDQIRRRYLQGDRWIPEETGK